ncbi:MAG: polysaccharide deacetylase family protein [Fusobacteriaceae bacterium]
MNILIALSQLEVTGAEVYGVTLANELIERGNNVWIVSDTLTKSTNAQYIKIEFNKRNLKNRMDQVKKLIEIIRENDIQVVHAHSRASSWAANIACKITGIPLVSTVHGRQPVHFSRKLIKGFGDYILPVCENIEEHIKKDLGVKRETIEVIRNPIDSRSYYFAEINDNIKCKISIIGRLSGPKGDVAYNILSELWKNSNLDVQVVGGKEVPERFEKFRERVNFLGYVDNVPQIIRESDIVIGAGRVAVEGILSGRPVIAVGEFSLLGVMDKETIAMGLASNFGDIGETPQTDYDFSKINAMVNQALNFRKNREELDFLRKKIEKEFSKEEIISKIEKTYQRAYVLKKKYDIPIIMYHRIIEDRDEEKGVHGNYTLKKDFEEQLKYLAENGYETLTFTDLSGNRYKNRFNRGKKKIILTFDDGYEDNYRVAFPILKKYKSKGVIYLMAEATYNKWDMEHPTAPEKQFNLMNDREIKEMQESGLVEFGVHTLTHPRLSQLTLEEIDYEINESKKRIEEKLGVKTISFAYPYGDYDERVKKIAQESGFEFVVATDRGSVCFSDDLGEIRRIGMFSKNTLFNFKRKVSGRYNFIKIKREKRKSGKKI